MRLRIDELSVYFLCGSGFVWYVITAQSSWNTEELSVQSTFSPESGELDTVPAEDEHTFDDLELPE